jgi:hypothetical protein
MSALTTRWPGAGPWDEVWFLEAHLPGGEALWLRYTLADAAAREVRLWAVWFGRGGVSAASEAGPLTPPGDLLLLHPRGLLAATPEGALATGTCGGLRWDLELRARGPGHDLVPPAIGRVGRSYRSEISDLTVHGELHTPDGPRTLDGARGVLGHIHGRRNRAQAWAWTHAIFPGHPEVVFEGLCARLGAAGLTTPPLTSIRLALDGEALAWSEPLDLVRTRSALTAGGWSFDARRGDLRLSGRMTLGPPARTACLRYADERGRPLWCRNSPDSRVELVLERPGLPALRLTTDHATAELASRRAPALPEHAP